MSAARAVQHSRSYQARTPRISGRPIISGVIGIMLARGGIAGLKQLACSSLPLSRWSYSHYSLATSASWVTSQSGPLLFQPHYSVRLFLYLLNHGHTVFQLSFVAAKKRPLWLSTWKDRIPVCGFAIAPTGRCGGPTPEITAHRNACQTGWAVARVNATLMPACWPFTLPWTPCNVRPRLVPMDRI